MALDDAEVSTTLDYLGRAQPLASQKLALTGGGTGGAVSAPITPTAPPGPLGGGGGGGTAPSSDRGGGFNALGLTGTALSLAEKLLGVKGKASSQPGQETANQVGSAVAGAGAAVSPDAAGAGVPMTFTNVAQTGALTPVQEAGQALLTAGVSPEAIMKMSPEQIQSAAAELGTSGAGGTDMSAAAGAEGTPGAGAGLGASLSTAAGLAASAWSIYQDVMAKTGDEQKAMNAAIDAAGAIATMMFPPAAAAVPLVKQQVGDLFAATSGNANPLQLAELAAGPAGVPLVMGEALASAFGIDLGGLFSHEGPYVPKRQAAAQEATADLSSLGSALQQSAQSFVASGNPADALQGLQTQFGERNAVRSSLWLPPDVAQSFGLTGVTRGNQVGIEWSNMNPAQFAQVLDYFQTHPEAVQAIQGSGDVAYLPQAQAEAVAGQAAQQAQAYVNALLKIRAAAPATPPAPPPPAAAGTPSAGAAVPTPLASGGPSGALGFANQLLETA